MNIFISYASEDRQVAEEVYLSLTGEGHLVFFDKQSLPPGGDYHARIRNAIQQSDQFIFLISPESVLLGSYALTELKFAREKWPHPGGGVLPVILKSPGWDAIPNYLKAVTVLEPEGNVAAEVVSAIAGPGQKTDIRQRLVPRIVTSIEPVESFLGDTGQEIDIAFSPSGELLAVGSQLWNFEYRYLKFEAPRVLGAKFSHDSQTLIRASDSEITVYRVSDGQCSVVWDAEDDLSLWPGSIFAISPDGQMLVTACGDPVSEDPLIHVFRIADWHHLEAIKVSSLTEDPEEQVMDLLLSPKGGKLAVVMIKKVLLVEPRDWRILQEYNDLEGDGFSEAAFSPNGELVASCSGAAVDIWQSSDGKRLQRFHPHISTAIQPTFFLGSDILITGGLKDGFVRFWRVRDGELLISLQAAGEGIADIALSPDGTTLVTSGYEANFEKSIRFWRVK